MDWIYNGEPFTTAPEDAFGFVYLITNSNTGQKYIGKKQFWSLLTKKVKDRKNRVHYKKESDWKKYWSSCGELKEDLQCLGEGFFTREIICFCATKGELTYSEVEHQIKNDVLKAKMPDGRQAFYNRNIFNKFFLKPDVISDETRRRLSEARKNWIFTEESKLKMSVSQQGNTNASGKRSPEYCATVSERMMGKTYALGNKQSEETRISIANSLKGNANRASTYRIIPVGLQPIIIKSLKSYCKENGYPYTLFDKVANISRPIIKGRYKGWIIELI